MDYVDLLRWHLQVRLFDQVDFLPFGSRQAALQHAYTLIQTYGPLLSVTLGSPLGQIEILQPRPA